MMRSWLRRTYNKEVYEYFKDLPPEIDPDNSTGRSTTFAVCLIGSNDSQGIAAQKQENFRRLKEKAGLNDYLPAHDYQRLPGIAYRGIPQIQLWFREKYSVAKANNRAKHPAEARVSFRLADSDWTSEAPAKTMALKIRDKFAKPIFQIEAGELKATYFDQLKGYDFRLLVNTKAESKQIIESVLDLNGHTPNWRLLKIHTSESEAFSETPQKVRVLGQTITVLTERPKTTLYFAYSIAKVPPQLQDIYLVDTSRRYNKAYYQEPNPYLGRQSRVSTNNNSVMPLN
jgi:hypothetical protein